MDLFMGLLTIYVLFLGLAAFARKVYDAVMWCVDRFMP